jgi:hypothetical protein
VFGNWFEAGEIWFNHHGQTYSDNAPAIGMPYQLDVYAKPGYLTLPHTAVSLVGAQGLLPRLALPPFGYLGVNLATVLVFPALPILAPGGKATTTVTIPNNAALRSQALYWQSAILDPAVGLRLTNPFVDIVQ